MGELGAKSYLGTHLELSGLIKKGRQLRKIPAILIRFRESESEKLLKIPALSLRVYLLLDIQDFTPQIGASIDAIGYFFTSVANS